MVTSSTTSVGSRKATQACPRHAGTDDLVVVEGDPARAVPTRPRLADVVEQRGQPRHDVRHAVVAPGAARCRRRRSCGSARPCGGGSDPARAAAPGISGRNWSNSPESWRNHRPGGRVVDREQLVELVADPLGRHDLEPRRHRRRRLHERRVGHEAVAGDEPGGPHHPQRVVAEGLLRRERSAQTVVDEQVGDAFVRIDEHRVREA